MDQYICTRGDTDFMLHENLKYWRYRMYLLPKDHPAMKKILDGLATRCDIFTEIQADSPKQQIEEFLKYVEMHLNRIKRMHCNKPRVSHRLLLKGVFSKVASLIAWFFFVQLELSIFSKTVAFAMNKNKRHCWKCEMYNQKL